MNKLLSMMF